MWTKTKYSHLFDKHNNENNKLIGSCFRNFYAQHIWNHGCCDQIVKHQGKDTLQRVTTTIQSCRLVCVAAVREYMFFLQTSRLLSWAKALAAFYNFFQSRFFLQHCFVVSFLSFISWFYNHQDIRKQSHKFSFEVCKRWVLSKQILFIKMWRLTTPRPFFVLDRGTAARTGGRRPIVGLPGPWGSYVLLKCDHIFIVWNVARRTSASGVYVPWSRPWDGHVHCAGPGCLKTTGWGTGGIIRRRGTCLFARRWRRRS